MQPSKKIFSFGLPYDEAKYRHVLWACALDHDLEALPYNDQTEVGEKGIQLSGGQRQRIGLARILYSNPDIVLLDDPLSAVDEQVGTHIFTECILKAWRDKVVILVTHQLKWLDKHFDWILVMKRLATDQKCIVEAQGPSLDALQHIDFISAWISEKRRSSGTVIIQPGSSTATEKTPRNASPSPQEERATGAVSWSIYNSWFSACGGPRFMVLALVSLFLVQGASLSTDFWLAKWTGSDKITATTDSSTMSYLITFLVLGVCHSLASWLFSLIFVFGGLRAAKQTFASALQSVLESPVLFFDTTPIGRILNRFSRDQDVIDTNLPEAMRSVWATLATTISTMTLISIVTPPFIAVLVPMIALYYWIQRFYRHTSLELKRMDSISRSPIYSHFSESILGLTTIRSMHQDSSFIRHNQQLMDTNNMASYLQLAAQRWLNLNLEQIGCILVLSASLACIFFGVSPSMAGLCIGYSFSVTGIMTWTARQAAEVEMNMNAMERLRHYAQNLEKESLDLAAERPEINIPKTETIVKFENVTLRYRPNLQPSLINVSFSIPRGKRVAIVGRTGSGKSTVMTTLFRLVDSYDGRVEIWGMDIREIPLEALRNRLAIIPQEPVLFSGTIRSNLDPLGEIADDQVLWGILEQTNLKELVSNLPEKLENKVDENGENFSLGQRQLFCLARAMLRKTDILLLDEATASVDLHTDAMMQQVLRSPAFSHVTILTIAHRLSTISDYDMVIRMDGGHATIEKMIW